MQRGIQVMDTRKTIAKQGGEKGGPPSMEWGKLGCCACGTWHL